MDHIGPRSAFSSDAMKRNSHLPFRLLFLLPFCLTVACDPGASHDEIWFPPENLGKADVVTVDGLDIPSAFVDPDATYLSSRSIDSLRRVGAITGVVQDVLQRADGIIAALPSNGRVELAELVRLESPPFFNALHPEEQAALADAWPYMQSPVGPTATLSEPVVEPLVVADLSTPPGGLISPSHLEIPSLPFELRAAAARCQLVANDDADANTIAVDDIDTVLAEPGAFTPAEVEALQKVLALFDERAVSVHADARAQVPTPGRTETSVGIAGTTIGIVAETTIVERRSVNTNGGGTIDLVVHRTVAPEFDLADENDFLLFMNMSTDRETVVKDAGSVTTDLPGGIYVVERYTDGVRSGSGFLDLAGIDKENTAKDITRFVDHALQTPTGVELTRNVQSTSWTPLTTRSLATFTWDLGEVPPTGTVDSSILARVATPRIALLPGRYELALDAGTLWIDIYPQGAVRYGLDGQMAGLKFRLSSGGKFWQAAYETTADLRVILDADDLLLQVFKGGYPSVTSYYNEPLRITDRIE